MAQSITEESRKLALDAIPVGIILADARQGDCPIIHANPAFVQMTRYSHDEVVGRNCRFLSGEDTDPDTRAEISKALTERRAFRGRILNYKKDGTPFWNELTITPISDGGDDVRYFVGVQIDITQRLQLEQSLREAQKMEAVGKLAGGIAHDFNNLLAIILGNAEVLQENESLEAESRSCVADIVSAVRTGAALVERMLEFSRSNSRDVGEVEVNHLIKATVALLERTIKAPIRFECTFDKDAGFVEANRASFETAFINLAVNAADAMPQGGYIRVATRRRFSVLPGAIGAVEVSVSDEGIGMDLETRTRAFEPFYTTKPTGAGSGLGLTMVQSFVTQSGGQLKIRSEEGAGTEVAFILPSSGPNGVEPGRGDQDVIVLVEDEVMFRRNLVHQLGSQNYQVYECKNGEEALSLIRELSKPTVVSDIHLAGQMSGPDLMRCAEEEGLDARFILMTGYVSGLEDAGLKDLEPIILKKPFQKQDLLAALDSLPD